MKFADHLKTLTPITSSEEGTIHQDPEWFHEWLEDNRKNDLDYIREQRNKVTKKSYSEVLEELNQVNNLKGKTVRKLYMGWRE